MHLPRLKEPDAFPGWFRQIVFRQCTRVLRQATLPYTSLEAVSDSLLAENNPEELAMQKEVQARIRSAVASLPQHERLVTVLFYGWHYTYNEVSAFLNIPLTTVKKRLYSARQKLKVQLRAALHDTIENVRRTDEGAEEAEVVISAVHDEFMLAKGVEQRTEIDRSERVDQFVAIGSGDFNNFSGTEFKAAFVGVPV